MWRGVVRIVPAVVAALILAAACGDDNTQAPQSSAIQVITTTGVIGDWVEVVGGDAVFARTLIPTGADAHTFQLTPRDIQAVAEADLVVLNGGGLESGFATAIRAAATGVILELADFVELAPFPEGLAHDHDDDAHEDEDQQGGEHEGAGQDDTQHEDDEPENEEHEEEQHGHEEGGLDPHFWLDPMLAIAAVEAIRDALIELAGGPDFGERAEAYAQELRALDAEVAQTLAALSSNQRAYGYFARRYDLEILGFVVGGPEAEPGEVRMIGSQGFES